jgi:hypothetical protein
VARGKSARLVPLKIVPIFRPEKKITRDSGYLKSFCLVFWGLFKGKFIFPEKSMT